MIDLGVTLILSLPLVGAYAIFALGIVLIYRASRMLNLAHGAMATVPAYVLYTLDGWGVPLLIGLPVSILSGAALGVAVEKIFVARLRNEGPTAQTVGTVAALGILVALTARIWGSGGVPAVKVFPQGRVNISASNIQYGEIGLFVVMLVVGVGLYLLISRTDLGLIMRGTAESRLAASLMGINPDRITSLTWAMGGALAALAGILLAAVTTLQPYKLPLQVLPAFIAALLGGMGSLPGALLGAAIVGASQAVVPLLGAIGRTEGAAQLAMAVLAIVVMATRGKSLSAADDEPTMSGTAARARKPPTRARQQGDRHTLAEKARAYKWTAAAILGVSVMALPFFDAIPSSMIGTANLAAAYSIVAVSLVLLTGWVGQISLGHAALVGIGSYATGHVVVTLGIPFPLSLPFAALASGLAAALLGAVALRVRGLYLGVATLIFSWMASEFLFRQNWFISNSQIPERPIGTRGTVPFFDFTDRRTFFLVAWAALGAVVFAAANVRDSKTGRAFFAVRGSELAAASLGIDVMRYKLLAFALSGAIGGLAGNLVMTDARVVSADQFTFTVSLFYLAVAVVGGLTSLPGAVASGIVFAALSELFFRVQALGALLELVSSVLLAVVLLAYRGGLASLPDRVRDRFGGQVDRVRSRATKVLARAAARSDGSEDGERELPTRRPLPAPSPLRTGEAAPVDFRAALRSAVDGPDASDESSELRLARERLAAFRPVGPRDERPPIIAARDITVQFGGLVAVNNASLEVREGEIVGLIGPNGAGKTTLFNAIAGYNSPTAGTIHLYGQDVTALPVHRRARVGVARTFQLIQLFSQLTVYENLLVATHVHNRTGWAGHLVVSSRSLDEERRAAARVEEVIELLDMGTVAHQRTADLPFGVLRMVEVARSLVTGFRLIMLDEPASGLDNTETDRLIEVLRFVRGLGVTLLLIEHDVRMVTGVSDYLYVLDQGSIIAEGGPEAIQRNPDVIAAYLGEPVEEMVG